MDPIAFKYLGAGLACIGMGLAAMGVGNIFGNFLSGALRNPSAADSQFARAFPEAAHLLGDRRLLEQQLVGRAGEGPVVGRGEEVAELLQGHRAKAQPWLGSGNKGLCQPVRRVNIWAHDHEAIAGRRGPALPPRRRQAVLP